MRDYACPPKHSVHARMTHSKRPVRPRDPNQLAKLIADIATGDLTEPVLGADGRGVAAMRLGRRGGLKGGRARAEALTPEKRREIATLAARTGWQKKSSEWTSLRWSS